MYTKKIYIYNIEALEVKNKQKYNTESFKKTLVVQNDKYITLNDKNILKYSETFHSISYSLLKNYYY